MIAALSHRTSGVLSLQLHHSSDAMQQGYGAVSFLRSKDDKGAIHCLFMMGKAAVLASRLDKIIRRETDLPIHESVFWTERTCVMNYIKSSDK